MTSAIRSCPDRRRVYHMLIATRKSGKGHIAEFTSTDLKEWAVCRHIYDHDVGPFLRMSGRIQDGRLVVSVYSEQASFMRKVQYFKAEHLKN